VDETARLEPFGEMDLSDSLLIIAFPTTGMAGPIAAHFLVRRLGLPLVGHVALPELTGLVTVHDGLATSPVRVHGGAVECTLDGGCPRVHVASSDVHIPPEAVRRVAQTLVASAKDAGARMVVCLEGVVRHEGDETPDVHLAAAQLSVLGELSQATGVEPAARALIVGSTAETLHAARSRDMAAGALIVEATRDAPDGRAAAALISVLDHLLPEIKVDPGPLIEEAMELEQEMAKARRDASESLPHDAHAFI
jgi:uncharacterized protein